MVRKYVITLESASRKDQYLSDNLHFGPYEFVEGVSDVSQHTFTVLPTYRDRIRNRAITEGEIGCMLSHAGVWQRIADGDDPFAFVFEDDVVISRSIHAISEQLTSDMKDIAWDWIYLSRKAINNDVGSGPVDGMVRPGYSYWACAYMISREGARKLCESLPLSRVIPVDEYVPLMAGVGCSTWQSEFRVSDFEMLSVDPLCAKPRVDSWRTSATEISKGYGVDNTQIRIFTVATHDNDGYRSLLDTAALYGMHVETLGYGESWPKGSRGGLKLVWLRDAISTMVDEAMVLFVDGFDVFFNNHIGAYKHLLSTYECDVLFCGEKTCWPDADVETRYPAVANTPFKYLNSGCFFGYAGTLRHMLHGASQDDDDQAFCTTRFLSRKFRIKIDHRCSMFQSIHGVSMSDMEIDVNKSVLYNKQFKTRALCIHANGPTDTKLIGSRLYNYVWWSDVYGSRMPTRRQGVRPVIFVSVLVRNKAHCITSMLAGLANLRYDPKRMVVRIVTNDNLDNTKMFVDSWVAEHRGVYEELVYVVKDMGLESYTVSDTCLGSLREEALEQCRVRDIEYFLSWDADIIVDDADTLNALIDADKSVVAPLVIRDNCRTWSNFWGMFDNNRYYTRSPDYHNIVTCKTQGTFAVALVREIYLVNLKRWPGISYTRHDAFPDIESYQNMALHAAQDDIKLYLTNERIYGTIVQTPPERFHDVPVKCPELFRYWEKNDAWLKKFIQPSTLALSKSPSLYTMLVQEVSPGSHVYTFPLFTQSFCDLLIRECEAYSHWSNGTHLDSRIDSGYENVPTNDIHLKQINMGKIWGDMCDKIVNHFAAACFNGFATKGVRMAFVVKYDDVTHNHLRFHHDSSSYTVCVTLNDDFEGGGTFFEQQRVTARPPVGWAVIHPGRCTHRHGALPTTRGKRYVLVSFND